MGTSPINSISLLIHLTVHLLDAVIKTMKKTRLNYYAKKLVLDVKRIREKTEYNFNSTPLANIFDKLLS